MNRNSSPSTPLTPPDNLTSADKVTNNSSPLQENGELFTRLQYDLFMTLIGCLEFEGISFPLRHCCNSAATVLYPEMHLDMVRPGIILYGYYPSDKVKSDFELNFLSHYMFRRINYDTYLSFKIHLKNKLNEIMPAYNKMFDMLQGWNLFKGQ